jgi:hypothetical protein
MSFKKKQALISAGSAAPSRRTRPLRQGRTQDELKKQLAEVRREKGKVSSFGYLLFSPPAASGKWTHGFLLMNFFISHRTRKAHNQS